MNSIQYLTVALIILTATRYSFHHAIIGCKASTLESAELTPETPLIGENTATSNHADQAPSLQSKNEDQHIKEVSIEDLKAGQIERRLNLGLLAMKLHLLGDKLSGRSYPYSTSYMAGNPYYNPYHYWGMYSHPNLPYSSGPGVKIDAPRLNPYDPKGRYYFSRPWTVNAIPPPFQTTTTTAEPTKPAQPTTGEGLPNEESSLPGDGSSLPDDSPVDEQDLTQLVSALINNTEQLRDEIISAALAMVRASPSIVVPQGGPSQSTPIPSFGLRRNPDIDTSSFQEGYKKAIEYTRKANAEQLRSIWCGIDTAHPLCLSKY